MTDETTAARPPAGWLTDATTGQTRWWDGTRWTEHVRPAVATAPVPMTRAAARAAARAEVGEDGAMVGREPLDSSAAVANSANSRQEPIGSVAYPYVAPTPDSAQRPIAFVPSNGYGDRSVRQPLTSRNGPAKASLILILLLVLGVGAVFWLLSGQDPLVANLVGLLNIVMVLAAFVLSVIGLVIAVRRPTKKRESVFALVASSLFMIFLAVRLVLSFTPTVLDDAVLEAQIATWSAQQTGESFQVACPSEPSAAAGTVFTCSATGDAGTAWSVQVTVNADNTVGWEVLG